MFDIGLQEMVVICVLALLVFGPSKLPELGRMFGRAMREFRRASDEFRSTVETNLHINDFDTSPPSEPATAASTETPALPALPSEGEPVGADPSGSDSTPGAPPEPPVEHGEPFVAQRGARLFHRRECIWVPRIPEIDRVYLKRVADAEEHGYLRCPACDPWEPA
jgi:Tat protein translocase TatB subunit